MRENSFNYLQAKSVLHCNWAPWQIDAFCITEILLSEHRPVFNCSWHRLIHRKCTGMKPWNGIPRVCSRKTFPIMTHYKSILNPGGNFFALALLTEHSKNSNIHLAVKSWVTTGMSFVVCGPPVYILWGYFLQSQWQLQDLLVLILCLHIYTNE
jgi:hypothetical protein